MIPDPSELVHGKSVDIEKPRYDQSTYIGRAKHFFITTNPLNAFKTSTELEEARTIVHNYRIGIIQPGLTVEKLWQAKNVYDSAFHPDTGEKMILIGRMSFQVPGNMFITGCLLQFYKSTPAVIFWQWFNQTFNAVVNYTNRSGDAPISLTRLGISYVLATGGALGTALTINKQVQKFPPIIGRFVPFIAVSAANCINIPCMRSAELTEGTPILDENGEKLGKSTVVGRRAVSQVVLSRILMASPGMTILPFVMQSLEKQKLLIRYPWLGAPIQISLVGLMLSLVTPLCCAVFPQISSIPFHKLEPDVQAHIKEIRSDRLPSVVYYNKGL
ncbi:unnamed protein product [Schistosoma bovis]|uniref:Sidoreflexin n=1 Tax=Schistosoma bovis TaxID=6184 RepID=A0A430QFQ0_SCHBO|nr:uncharacterized protein DC041_0012194 [Schistosoma bovis]CAH8583686.1 unnamed protein product [Schistosoma bovis]CAH8588827.1 unnamed protein product [Schistosoma bovis]